jgi:hypothetical protein
MFSKITHSSSHNRNIDDNNVKVVVDLHGVIQSKIFKIPDNVNVVFMSPVSYITCTRGSMLDYLNDKNNLHNFLKNPSCFNKNKVNEKLEAFITSLNSKYEISNSFRNNINNYFPSSCNIPFIPGKYIQ